MVYQGDNDDNDQSRNIIRSFTKNFEVDKCQGESSFFKLDHLISEGFLDVEEDKLILQYYVRPPTYYQQCKDLIRYRNVEYLCSQLPIQ